MPFPAKSKGTTSRRTADSRTGNVATIALLAALALIFSYVEAIIPYNPGVPGIKLGIANIIALVALYRLSAKHAAAVNVIRILIAGLLFNGVFGALYSLGGAAISLLGMVALKTTNSASPESAWPEACCTTWGSFWWPPFCFRTVKSSCTFRCFCSPE